MPALLLAGLLCALAAAFAGGPARAASPNVIPAATRILCTFDTDVIGEASGMTVTQLHPDLAWMTNDSGGGPYLYAVDLATCAIRATLRLLDTPARDHEALASGVDAQGRHVIWVGDIGDNIDGWPYARIHKVVEPKTLADADVEVTTYRFRYPDGSVNAEALMAAPDREQLWVVTKEYGVGALIELPSPMSDSRTPMRTKQVGTARSLITDAAMSPDGTRYVVRDYLSAEIFNGEPPGESVDRFGLPLQPQGEAITWTADGRSLLIASERSGALQQVDVGAPPEKGSTGTGGGGGSSPSADPGDVVVPADDGSPMRGWVLLACALTGLVAVVLWARSRSRGRPH